MLNADTDYARIVSLLTKQQLAPYVAYAKSDDVAGLVHAKENRVVVRVSDGKIVSGDSEHEDHGNSVHFNTDNPVTHPAFDPTCYRAVAEEATTYEHRDAVRFTLEPSCPEKTGDDETDHPFTTLYADARTLRPLEASGTAAPRDARSVTVNVDERYGEFEGRILPTHLNVEVDGTGWMFWLHLHVVESYDDYQFLNSPSA